MHALQGVLVRARGRQGGRLQRESVGYRVAGGREDPWAIACLKVGHVRVGDLVGPQEVPQQLGQLRALEGATA